MYRLGTLKAESVYEMFWEHPIGGMMWNTVPWRYFLNNKFLSIGEIKWYGSDGIEETEQIKPSSQSEEWC